MICVIEWVTVIKYGVGGVETVARDW